jgi:hypothetical protein
VTVFIIDFYHSINLKLPIYFSRFRVLRSWIKRIANMASLNSSVELKDDTVIVVLGASGDLAKKKTVCSPLKLISPAVQNSY